jgi:prepilin-type N-terminal cleavage/methylation domain-containing protein
LFDIWILKFGFTMKSKMKKLHKGQRGLTFVELLIVIAITGFIAAAITGVLFQVLTINTRTSNRMTAVRQVQQAGFWVSPDVQMAQNVTPGGCTNCLLSLNWTEVAGNHTTHQVIYRLVDMSGGLKRLTREHYVGNGTSPDSTIVAEYISSASFVKLPSGNAYNFTVTATVGAESETRLYEVKPRPGA